MAAPHAGPGPGPAANDLAFRLTLPGGQPPDEENFSFGLWGVPMSGDHEELTQDVLSYSHQASEKEGAGGTYHCAPEALSQFYFVRLVVRLRLNGESSTQVYELHRRGRSLSSEWHRVEALTDSFFSSVKLGTWPSMSLTPLGTLNKDEACLKRRPTKRCPPCARVNGKAAPGASSTA